MLSAVIDAKEGREVAVVDIPNAFIQTENEKLQDHHKTDILKVKGKLADMLIQIAPEIYAPYATKENEITVIVWMNALGMSTTATSLPSLASITADNITDSKATVGLAALP